MKQVSSRASPSLPPPSSTHLSAVSGLERGDQISTTWQQLSKEHLFGLSPESDSTAKKPGSFVIFERLRLHPLTTLRPRHSPIAPSSLLWDGFCWNDPLTRQPLGLEFSCWCSWWTRAPGHAMHRGSLPPDTCILKKSALPNSGERPSAVLHDTPYPCPRPTLHEKPTISACFEFFASSFPSLSC